jgi:hypothetical protein
VNLCSRSQAHIIDVFVTAAEVSSPDDRDTSVDRDDPIIVGGKYPLRRLGKSICKPLIGCALFSMPLDISRTEITLMARSISSTFESQASTFS